MEKLTIEFKNKAEFEQEKLPFINNGGIFIPFTKNLDLNTDVELNINLAEDHEILSINGKIVWLAHDNAEQNNAVVGVQFIDNKASA